ncbi:MAG TPA: AEC family transporter [Candidatus Agrococcus pullicola]|uniref:AEC family transporter n=1 Tax=Candidatus Agrococcus pullicola TaxID=2838429 RepID=A0A9D1YZE1_9MICO|nr:AEC family transporter [Candidatus Agrococcus pullicola]
MAGVFTGFGIIAFVIFVGWLLSAINIVSQEGRLVLNRVAFFAASPALLFLVLSRADLKVVFSGVLLASAATIAIAAALYWAVARALFTKDPGRLVIGTSASVYANINNIGLPVAIYVIGDAQYVGPMLILQLVVMAPIVLGALDLLQPGRKSIARILLQPVRNPIVIASALGVVVAATGLQLPEFVEAPLEILGGAAIPLMLLAFGVSLRGTRPLERGTGRREVLVASVMKAIVMPVIAWVLAAFVFGLEPVHVYAVTVMAALPTAQNMYQYALRYNTGEIIARDVIFVTTLASIPVMLVIAWLVHP